MKKIEDLESENKKNDGDIKSNVDKLIEKIEDLESENKK